MTTTMMMMMMQQQQDTGDKYSRHQHHHHHTADRIKSPSCPRAAILRRPRFVAILCFGVLFSLWLLHTGVSRSQQLLEKGGTGAAYTLGLRYDKSWFDKTRPMDISDPQWSTFRDFLPILFALGMLFVLLRRAIDATLSRWMQSRTPTMVYYILTSLAFSYAFMGSGAVFPLLCFAVNYGISRTLRGSKWNPILTWAFNVFVLVTGDYFNGYPFTDIVFWDPRLGARLDRLRGLLPWQVYFKMLLCRFISFNLDLHAHLNSPQGRMTEEEAARERARLLADVEHGRTRFTTVESEHRFRQRQLPRRVEDYSLVNFFVFVFYLPLYIAGPLCTFNAFVSYLYDRPQQQFSWRSILWNAALVAIYSIAVDIMLHYNYMHMFSERRLWHSDNMYLQRLDMAPMTPLEVLCMWLTVLTFMFMKFIILWRLFRFWAIADGINPPENMNRCIFSTYKVSHFWRAWHRSLHEWSLAYIYIPLGGSKHRIRNNMLIFFFMAIWHDLWMRWIAWASFNIALLALEIAVGIILPGPALRRLQDKPYFALLMRLVLGANGIFIGVANMAIMYSFTDTLVLIFRTFMDPAYLWDIIVIAFVLFPIYGDFALTLREVEEECGDKKPF